MIFVTNGSAESLQVFPLAFPPFTNPHLSFSPPPLSIPLSPYLSLLQPSTFPPLSSLLILLPMARSLSAPPSRPLRLDRPAIRPLVSPSIDAIVSPGRGRIGTQMYPEPPCISPQLDIEFPTG